MTIFDKIINKEIESSIFFENKDVIAIFDINPKVDNHVLVIPKKHSTNLMDISDDDLKFLIIEANTIAKSLIAKINATGFQLIINNGESAGQEIFHTHIHILPYM